MKNYYSEVFLAHHSRLLLDFDVSDDVIVKISGLSSNTLYKPRFGYTYPVPFGDRVFGVLNELGFYKENELNTLNSIIEHPEFFVSYLLNSPSIYEVIDKCNHYLDIFSPGVKLTLSHKADRLYIYFNFLINNRPDYLVQGVVFSVVKIIEKVIPNQVTPGDIQIGISTKGLPNPEQFSLLTTEKLSFNKNSTYISYPLYLFNIPNTNYNPLIANFFQDKINEIQIGDNDEDEFFKSINKYFDSGFLSSSTKLSSDALACKLGMSRTTLYRKLAERNITFKELLDEKRKECVLSYLKDKSLSMGEISDLLGYANLSAFYRAFKRWYDAPPSLFR